MESGKWPPAFVALVLATLVYAGDAFIPLMAEGQAGFWNQLVVGADKAYNDRIGGLTLESDRPIASFVDRETPATFKTRWDITVVDERLVFMRGADGKTGTETLSFNPDGSSQFNGALRVDGVLRAKNLHLTSPEIGDGVQAFMVGTNKTTTLRLANDKTFAYIQSDRGNLALNPYVADQQGPQDESSTEPVDAGVVVFSYLKPRKHLDVRSDVWLESALKLGPTGETTLSGEKLEFSKGGGWEDVGADWVSTLKQKPVHFGGGAVFGSQLGIGIEVKRPDFKLQVHDGHFVVTDMVSADLKGVTSFVMPSGSFIKAYDYTRKKLQKLRITGTKILINPGQQSDGRTCIGCSNPEHHLQSEGNMYVNGNIFVNKNLHVSGHMHIDKVITPQVFIHSQPETPQQGRGLMIGNDLDNKHRTNTNMRIGYKTENKKGYGWIQSHPLVDVPVVVNPLGGSTCIACTEFDTDKAGNTLDVELQVSGDILIDGEIYVATLKNKKHETKPLQKEPTTVFLEESETESPSLSQVKQILSNQKGVAHMDLVHAWASATKLIQANSAQMQAHKQLVQENARVIRSLEAQIADATN